VGIKNLTPAMRQYCGIKEQYPDCILFFRMGDFYEMFFDDAEKASRILDIALTSRNKNKDDAIPLCGVPYHAAASYIARLIEEGLKVAICEQVEDPKEAKGIVKRDVVRVVTPGLNADADMLVPKENNYFAAVSYRDGVFGLAVVDISTGEFLVTDMTDREAFIGELVGFEVKEIVVPDDGDDAFLRDLTSRMDGCLITKRPPDYFDCAAAVAAMTEVFSECCIESLSAAAHPVMTGTAGAALRYIEETQKSQLAHLRDIRFYTAATYLILDETAKRNLELFETIQGGRTEGSLFHVLDATVTGMGGRRLRSWLAFPRVDKEGITRRLAAVSELVTDYAVKEKLRLLLHGVYDLERLGGRITMGTANGRDLIQLKQSLQSVPDIVDALGGAIAPFLVDIRDRIDDMADIAALVERAIQDEPPMTVREGHLIKPGYNDGLDEIVSVSTDGKKWIAALEKKERSRTGIATLKVGFNNVFGYYIEVSKANTHLIPDGYVRKQTLVNGERYINEELKEYESTVLNAEEERKRREYELFAGVRDRVAGEIRRIQHTASLIADLDAIASLADVAERNNYVCPHIAEDDRIEIIEGRHPVVERIRQSGGFVPNDLSMDCDGNRFLIITGPNMAGKSTYIRQTALIVIMAQMGSFVPARSATVGIVDKIFTRVGAADNLARGQSTFMVEMTEVAALLQKATRKSLILLDEVGRGTSTFDGLSIAWAVAEYIHDRERLGARTLFATHYHELTDMARTGDGIRNYSIAVKEWGDDVIFLRKIVPGGATRSYGIQVARLAGVPGAVIDRAREILENLEKGELDDVGMPTLARGGMDDKGERQERLPLFVDDEETILREISSTDVARMTPLEALKKIDEWQKKLTSTE